VFVLAIPHRPIAQKAIDSLVSAHVSGVKIVVYPKN